MAASPIEGYRGHNPRGPSFAVAERAASALSPAELWAFVARCEPVVIRGGAERVAGGPAAAAALALPSLRRLAGDALVHVEHRDERSRGFGCGRRSLCSFASFADKLLSARTPAESQHYLSTQPIDEDARTGLPLALVAAPLSALRKVGGKGKSGKVKGVADDDAEPFLFALRPELVGRLVPSSVNLWIGSSREGTSSGLHHDFHLNLYSLLEGVKRFTLASPAMARCAYLAGRIERVHANGLISYMGHRTHADGRPVEVDDEVEDEDEDEAGADAMWAAILGARSGRKRGREEAQKAARKAVKVSSMSFFPSSSSSSSSSSSLSSSSLAVAGDTQLPSHFSRIPLAALRRAAAAAAGAEATPASLAAAVQKSAEVAARFPLWAEAALVTCELRAGDALLLPQGWLHEVESSGGRHVALNHWFWPPTSKDARAPYGTSGAFFEAAFARQLCSHVH